MKKVLSLAVLAVLLGAPGVVRAQEHVHIPPPPPPPPRPEVKVEAPKPPPKVLTAAETVAAAFGTAVGTPVRPSASVAYITAGAAPAFSNFGKIALPDGAAPSENTVYEIGSITKGLTG